MGNTNVKPIMSVALQQKRQLLMCNVSTCKSYSLLHVVSCISQSKYINLLLCNFFAGEACLFLGSASAR